MRKFSFEFVVTRSMRKGLPHACVSAWLLCVLLLLPANSRASTTASGVATPRLHRGHSSHDPAVVRHSAKKRTVHPALRKTSPQVRHTSSYRRRRSRRLTHEQRYRLAATLDKVRTHDRPLGMEPNSTEDLPSGPGEHPDAPRPLTLALPGTTPSAVASPSTDQNASTRDIPTFNPSVPRFMPLALRGSHDVLVHQNVIADVEGLSRIQNDAQLGEMVRSGDLVALPASSALFVDPRLPMNRRYCRPWTAKFLSDLSRAHQATFGRPLQLTSAVRTVAFQRHLARYNGNAAPAYGETASPHLTGQAIDLGKKGMSHQEIAWMRTILGQLQNSGRLDVEEEFEQACFHISVYKTYAPQSAVPKHLVAANDMAPVEDTAAKSMIGVLAQPAPRRATLAPAALHRTLIHTRSYGARNTRRVAAHRHRRHHSSMSLLAVHMR